MYNDYLITSDKSVLVIHLEYHFSVFEYNAIKSLNDLHISCSLKRKTPNTNTIEGNFKIYHIHFWYKRHVNIIKLNNIIRIIKLHFLSVMNVSKKELLLQEFVY